jgi:hypothetical protein
MARRSGLAALQRLIRSSARSSGCFEYGINGEAGGNGQTLEQVPGCEGIAGLQVGEGGQPACQLPLQVFFLVVELLDAARLVGDGGRRGQQQACQRLACLRQLVGEVAAGGVVAEQQRLAAAFQQVGEGGVPAGV